MRCIAVATGAEFGVQAAEQLFEDAREFAALGLAPFLFFTGQPRDLDDTPLAFREKAKGLWVANRFRLYGDLRSDPRRGREQADHLRQEVIGF